MLDGRSSVAMVRTSSIALSKTGMIAAIDWPTVSSPLIFWRLLSRFSLTALRVCASPSCNATAIFFLLDSSLLPELGGVYDVKSGAEGHARDGSAYLDW